MPSILEKIKQKPEGARKRIALFTAASITLVIALLWFTLPSIQNSGAAVAGSGADLGPIQNIKSGIVSLYTDARDRLKDLFQSAHF